MSQREPSMRNSASAENTPKRKVCEKCGVKFDCYSAGAGCWCEDITLEPQTLARLRGQHTDCLCPACLRAAQDSR